MYIDTIIWLYALIALAIIVLLCLVKQIAKVRVWIEQKPKTRTSSITTGYLDMSDDGAAGEVHLPGGGSLPSIGRVIVEKRAGKEHGFVEVIANDIDDETTRPSYKQTGYICFNEECLTDKYGYIYHQERGKREKTIIGYCARPSDPETPTIYGERNWRTLWLKCTLNAYLGKPAQSANNSKQEKATTAMAIHADVNEEANIAATDETTSAQLTPQAQEQQSEQTKEELKQENAKLQQESAQQQEESAQPTPQTQEQQSEQTKEDEKEEQKEEQKVVPPAKASKNKKKKAKEPAATAYYYGFHSSAKDYLPAEARACAYALLSGGTKKRKYTEFFKDQPYGWGDTALLTSFIYTILFLVLYTVNTAILQMPLLGDDIAAVSILIAFYYVLWALVRLVKIDSIETSNSFQKRLDLFNKNLGLSVSNYTIIVLCIISIYFSLTVYDFDFIPLIWAIMWGVIVNMQLKGANAKWLISTTFNEKNDEEDDGEEIKNPPGDISRTYEWELDHTYSTQRLHGSLTLYFTGQEMADVRQCNPFFAQRKDKSDKEYILDMFNFLKEHKRFLARTKYIAKYIHDTIVKNNLTPIDEIQFTLDFVQEPNITFVKNENCKVVNHYKDYIRYPDETLYDKEGDHNSKSLLAAALFCTMGHNVMYLTSRKYQHAAIGIEVRAQEVENGWYGSDIEEKIIRENGKCYIYCETTGDRFRIGKTIDGMSINEFDEKVLFETESDEANETEYTTSNIYNWELDSLLGNTLHGNLTIKFDEERINAMRENNPFHTYGMDANSYEQNVASMHNYLRENSELCENVEIVAQYIKKEIEKAGYPEIDLLQFALNFVQAPNITYRIDEECPSIDFKQEYMRFPEETMYDKEGDCDCKSFLTAAIFNKLGYNVIFLLSQKLKHAAMAVECKDEWLEIINAANVDNVVLEHNGHKYIYCESTGYGNKIGQIKEGESIKDFEKIVELPV